LRSAPSRSKARGLPRTAMPHPISVSNGTELVDKFTWPD
jgi:hypothetical protein